MSPFLKVLYVLAACAYLAHPIQHAGVGSASCAGTTHHLDAQNVLLFEDCQHVSGNLIINQHSLSSAHITYNKLLLLSQIREIDGYLLLKGLNHTDITDLRFLRSLEVIHGHQTLQLFGQQDYALVIEDNPYLRTLSLASLHRIVNGGVRIQGNPELCLVDSVPVRDYLVNSDLSRIGGHRFDCSGVNCHEQCNQSSGCWGTLPDECIMCRGYQYMDTCVQSCNTSVSYSVEGSFQCYPLQSLSSPPSSPLTHTTPAPVTMSQGDHTHSHTHSTSSDHLSTAVTADNRNTLKHFVLSFTVVGIVLFTLLVLLLLLAYCQCQSKKKKKRKQSLLQIQHAEHSITDNQSSGTDTLKQVVGIALDSSFGSSCVLRKTGVSLASPKSKLPEYETILDGVQRREVITEVTPRVSVVTETDSGCYDSSMEPNGHTVNTMAIRADPTSYQRVLVPDSKLQQDNHHYPWPQSMERTQSTSPASNRTSPHTDTEHEDTTTSDRGSITPEHYNSLFPSWRQPASNARLSPGIQRPMTMGGGVYSTGHHRHLSNHSHGNSYRGSLTSSHGTGNSARTSAMTSRSGSQQFGSSSTGYGSSSAGYGSSSTGYGSSSTGYSSAVFGVRNSKTPSQCRDEKF